ncbi:ribose-phosphate diphosphokinase [archaeon]|nr:ribose-phosphate diphosphokinase [archaeon]
MDYVIGIKDEFNQHVAEALDCQLVELEKHVFPDGELRPRILGETNLKGKKVLLINRTNSGSAYKPNQLLMETLFTVKNLNSLGAKVDLLLPYFPYAMQDKVFRPGEPHAAKYVLELLKSSGVNTLFVVCAHMQREQGTLKFAEGIIDAHSISVFKDLAENLKNYELENPVVIAPDFTSGESADKVAEALGASDSKAIHKKRDLDTNETIINEEDITGLEGLDVIIVDDIAETGGTMAKAIDLCKKRGAGKIICAAVHPVLAGDCLERIKNKGADFIATNTIDSEISKISVEHTLAEYIKKYD